MREKGLFIVFEGIDGSGKTTQLQKTVAFLEKRDLNVVVTREPGGTTLGAKIRSLLLDVDNQGMDPLCELMLYAADRSHHVTDTIEPAISRGDVVICDRYALSTLAYQGYGRGLPLDTIRSLNQMAIHGCVPDLTFILDMDPIVARTRIARHRAQKPDRLEQEKLDFFERVRRGYLTEARQAPQRCAVMDGARRPEDVFQSIKEILEPLLCTLR